MQLAERIIVICLPILVENLNLQRFFSAFFHCFLHFESHTAEKVTSTNTHTKFHSLSLANSIHSTSRY